jgi:hypothetical protein
MEILSRFFGRCGKIKQINIQLQFIISRLDRIKKIDAHKNVTITTEKYIKLQEF